MSPEEFISYNHAKPFKATIIATAAGFEVYLDSKLAHFYKARGYNWGAFTLTVTGDWDVTEVPF